MRLDNLEDVSPEVLESFNSSLVTCFEADYEDSERWVDRVLYHVGEGELDSGKFGSVDLACVDAINFLLKKYVYEEDLYRVIVTFHLRSGEQLSFTKNLAKEDIDNYVIHIQMNWLGCLKMLEDK